MNVTRIVSENTQTEPLRTLARRARNLLRPRKRRHDPLLVLSLATFTPVEAGSKCSVR